MKAVSTELLETIRELQSFKSLENFSLGGGTNLALRYNHRASIDIDLFHNSIVGKSGFENVVSEAKQFYGGNFFGSDFPCDIDDQYIFLRFFVRKKGDVIKVEVLQNFKVIDEPEIVKGVRLLTEKDIGLLKLMSVSNRGSFKDVYDLEYLTERIPLLNLYELLKRKQEVYNQSSDKTIFSLDNEESPIGKPELLLNFDSQSQNQTRSRPMHTHDRLLIADDGKTWMQARSAWRRKVRQLFNHLGEKFPDVTSMDT